jgi:hypothetical protein
MQIINEDYRDYAILQGYKLKYSNNTFIAVLQFTVTVASL